MVLQVLPMETYAWIGPIFDRYPAATYSEETSSGKTGKYTAAVLQNDYIRFELDKGTGTIMRTVATRAAKGTTLAGDIDKCVYQELSFKFKSTKLNISSVKVTDGGDAIRAVYLFSNSNLKAEVEFRLVKASRGKYTGKQHFPVSYGDVEDDGRTWMVVANCEYWPFTREEPSTNKMMVTVHRPSAMGHAQGKTQARLAASYCDTSEGDYEAQYQVISGGMSYASAWGMNEIFSVGYNHANPFFVMDGGYDLLHIPGDILTDGIEGQGTFMGGGDVYASYVPAQSGGGISPSADVLCYEAINSSDKGMILGWGFRDLYRSDETIPNGDDSTATEYVTIEETASKLAVVPSGSSYKIEQLEASASVPSTAVAVYQGNFSWNPRAGYYEFSSGASLTPTTQVTFDAGSGGYFRVKPDGTIQCSGINLNTPAFMFYKHNSAACPAFSYSKQSGKTGLSLTIDPSKNDAVVNMDIPYSTTKLTGAFLYTNGDVSFSGDVTISTIFNDAMTLKQLMYGKNSSGKFTSKGMEASARINNTNLFGLQLSNVVGEINTMNPAKPYYHFEVNVNAFDMLTFAALLELKKTNDGTLMPNSLRGELYVGAGGIPLIPPAPVYFINGGGLGFYNLVDTLNGDYVLIPPIKLTGSVGISVAQVMSGKVDLTLGLTSIDIKGRDLKIPNDSGVKLVDSIYTGVDISGAKKQRGGTVYTGLNLNGYMGMETDLLSVIKTNGRIDLNMFGGLNDSNTKLYLLLDASGKIGAVIHTPDEWFLIGGLELAKTQVDFVVGADTVVNVSGNKPIADVCMDAVKDIRPYIGVCWTGTLVGLNARVYYVAPKNGKWATSDNIDYDVAIGELDKFDIRDKIDRGKTFAQGSVPVDEIAEAGAEDSIAAGAPSEDMIDIDDSITDEGEYSQSDDSLTSAALINPETGEQEGIVWYDPNLETLEIVISDMVETEEAVLTASAEQEPADEAEDDEAGMPAIEEGFEDTSAQPAAEEDIDEESELLMAEAGDEKDADLQLLEDTAADASDLFDGEELADASDLFDGEDPADASDLFDAGSLTDADAFLENDDAAAGDGLYDGADLDADGFDADEPDADDLDADDFDADEDLYDEESTSSDEEFFEDSLNEEEDLSESVYEEETEEEPTAGDLEETSDEESAAALEPAEDPVTKQIDCKENTVLGKDDKLILRIIPKKEIEATREEFFAGLLVDNKPLELMVLNDQYEVVKGNTLIRDEEDDKPIYVFLDTVDEADKPKTSWIVESKYGDFDLELMRNTPYETMTASISDTKLNVSVSNLKTDAIYELHTYYGSEKGGADYVVDVTQVNEGKAIAQDNYSEDLSAIALPTTGTFAVSGSYYVTSTLMQVLREDFDGDGTISDSEIAYLPVNTFIGSTPIGFTNSLTPAAPSSVTLAPAGNESMEVTFDQVANADGYQIAIYQGGADTGYGYDFTEKDGALMLADTVVAEAKSGKFTVRLNPTVGSTGTYKTESGETVTANPVLQPGDGYSVGVSAYKNLSDDTNAYPLQSARTMSSNIKLSPYQEADITISVNGTQAAVDPETGIYSGVTSVTDTSWELAVKTTSGYTVSVTNQNDENSTATNPANAQGRASFMMESFTGVAAYIISVTNPATKDVTTRYLTVRADDIPPVLLLDQDAYSADDNGNFTITGKGEPGCMITMEGGNTIAVEEDGTFVLNDNIGATTTWYVNARELVWIERITEDIPVTSSEGFDEMIEGMEYAKQKGQVLEYSVTPEVWSDAVSTYQLTQTLRLKDFYDQTVLDYLNNNPNVSEIEECNFTQEIEDEDLYNTLTTDFPEAFSFLSLTQQAAGRMITLIESDEQGNETRASVYVNAHLHVLTHMEEKARTCTDDGNKEYYHCEGCGRNFYDASGNDEIFDLSAVTIPRLGGTHTYSPWTRVQEPTVFAAGRETATCTRCGHTASHSIPALKAAIALTCGSIVVKGTIPLKFKQALNGKIKAVLQPGDSIKSVSSSNSKYAAASFNGTTINLKAGKKKGTATITVMTKANAKITFKVKAQKAAVVCKKIPGFPKKLTLKKGETYQLPREVTPISATGKVKFKSSNKKIAKVTGKGKIKALKKGKATITATIGKKSFKCKVTVIE